MEGAGALMNDCPHWSIWETSGANDSPRAVKEYSTFGGTWSLESSTDRDSVPHVKGIDRLCWPHNNVAALQNGLRGPQSGLSQQFTQPRHGHPVMGATGAGDAK